MAETSSALEAPPVAVADLERAEKFTREPFVHEGEDAASVLTAGTPRRRALEDALSEIDAGRTQPSPEWRRHYSLMLGLERLLAQDEPHLVDGTVLSPHQVDALSGTLIALLAEAQASSTGRSNGNGTYSNGSANGRTLEELHSGEIEIEGDEELDDDDEPLDWDEAEEHEEEDATLAAEAAEDPNAARRFWFEHATGAGKTVAALGFVEATRTGGVLILTHRRNLVDQFIGELTDRGYKKRIAPALLIDHKKESKANGPVTVETYQWYVRNAGKISDAYTVVICDEAHTALGEKTVRVDQEVEGAGLRRHDGDRRADRPPRHRPLPHPDLALRPRAGGAARRHRSAARRPDPARRRCPHDRQGAAAQGRGRPGLRPGRAGRAARPGAVQRGRRRPLPVALQGPARRRLRRRRAARLQRREGLPGRRHEGEGRSAARRRSAS